MRRGNGDILKCSSGMGFHVMKNSLGIDVCSLILVKYGSGIMFVIRSCMLILVWN